MPATIVQGHCDSRFQAVADAFAENFSSRGEIGASVAVSLEGQLVVDLWGGHLDANGQRPWLEDSLVNVWSLGKAMSALALLKLMDSGALDPQSRVSDCWPEFAANGKGDIDFTTLMSHQAGLPAVASILPEDAYFNWDLMCNALANQKPWWEPGKGHGYHTNTFGFLLGEPIRRLTGVTLNEYFQTHIAQPLGISFLMGTPESEMHRLADVINMERPADFQANFPLGNEASEDPLSNMRYCVYRNPPLQFEGKLGTNSKPWRSSEFPSTSPQSNARSTATVFGTLAMADQKLLSAELLSSALKNHADGNDLVLNRPTRFGLGFQLSQPDRPLGPNASTYGHYGNGGHLGFADPTCSLGFAYHMNHHGFAWRDPRNIALTDAVYSCF